MPFDSEATPKSRALISLEKARAKISVAWWHQPSPETNTMDSVCIVIAFGEEMTRPWKELGFKSAVEAAEWNDAPGRTQAEVLARFDAAIERLARS